MDAWGTYIFQYIVGGIVFATGILLSVLSKEVNPQRKEDRKDLYILIIGLIGYALFHCLWILLALHT